MLVWKFNLLVSMKSNRVKQKYSDYITLLCQRVVLEESGGVSVFFEDHYRNEAAHV